MFQLLTKKFTGSYEFHYKFDNIESLKNIIVTEIY